MEEVDGFDVIAHDGKIGLTPADDSDDRFLALHSLEIVRKVADADLAERFPQ